MRTLMIALVLTAFGACNEMVHAPAEQPDSAPSVAADAAQPADTPLDVDAMGEPVSVTPVCNETTSYVFHGADGAPATRVTGRYAEIANASTDRVWSCGSAYSRPLVQCTNNEPGPSCATYTETQTVSCGQAFVVITDTGSRLASCGAKIETWDKTQEAWTLSSDTSYEIRIDP